MGGALKSVFGGSGGIFGAVLGVASMFFPPLAVAGSLSNMLTTAIGEAVKMAASALVKEFAMPKFLESLIGQVVDNALPKLLNQSNPEVDAHTQEQFGSQVQDFKRDFAKELIDQTVKFVHERAKEKTDGKANDGKRATKASGGSWLEAMARAMGEVMGEKAAKMAELSNKLSELSTEGNNAQAGLEAKYGGNVKGMDDKTLNKYSTEKSALDQKNAREMTATSQELQGVSQTLNILQTSFSTSIKTIGEALSQAARKG